MPKKHSVFFYCLLELKNWSDSKLVERTAETVNKKKSKVTWAWKIQCGLCSKHLQLRIDGGQADRIYYFKSPK